MPMALTEGQPDLGSIGQFVRNEVVAVSTSSVVICRAARRQAIAIRNSSTGAQVITLHLGFGLAIANQGIVLRPGESFVDSNVEGYEVFQGEITAISDAVNGQVSIFER